MTLAIARMIVVIELLVKNIPVAIVVFPGSAFLADVVGAAHEG